MQQFGQYVVTLTAAALISGMILSLFPEGSLRELIRLVCGVFLTVTAILPLMDITLPNLPAFGAEYLAEGQAAAKFGEQMAKESVQLRIKEQLEAYILDKAFQMGAEIMADISVNESGNPESIQLSGEITDVMRRQLQECITNDLGIPKENQQWIG